MPRAHADARGRTRDSRISGRTEGRGETAGFADALGFSFDLTVFARTGFAAGRGFGMRVGSTWPATRRLKPRNQSLVRLFDIRLVSPKHLIGCARDNLSVALCIAQ
ncbi:hypothetical protein [Caballeronia concitans]|uniref:hypothetical protein n=1 Tax=Caballeronia concitans TaxID=1777133 RepID=UPI001FCB4928|nr:hypothetical protein [Caballeronia concitans]